MPYLNEHAARVRNPASFEPDSFRSKELKDGVRLILGKLKNGNGSMTVQAYRFPVDNFTVEQARKWLEDNKVKFIKFEPSSEIGESMNNNDLKHYGILGMRWGVRRGTRSNSNMGVGKYSKNSKLIKARKIEKGWNKVKNEPISKYMQRKKAAQRGKKLALIALGVYVLGPSIIRGVGRVGVPAAKIGIAVGKLKISNFKASRKFEKYGGFDPMKVVNSTMRDAPIRALTTNLLTGGR